MRRLVYLSSARSDLADILLHIAREAGDVGIAQAFVGRLMERCDRLASLPGTIGTARPELPADIRSTPHRNYVIFFRYKRGAVEIVNVLNASRDVITHYDA